MTSTLNKKKSQVIFLKGRMNPQQGTPPWSAQEGGPENRAGCSVWLFWWILAMAASFHCWETNLAVPWLGCDLVPLFLSNLQWFCCYKGLCMILSCHWFSFNSFFKHPALFFTSCHTDILLYMNIPQLCSCWHQKGKNNYTKPPKDRKFPSSPSCCEKCDSLPLCWCSHRESLTRFAKGCMYRRKQ